MTHLTTILLFTSCILNCVNAQGQVSTITSLTPHQEIAQTFLQDYDAKCLEDRNLKFKAEFTYRTNITDYNEEQMVTQEGISAKFDREWRIKAMNLNINENTLSPDLQRQLRLVKHIGISALPDDKSAQLSGAISEMEGLYGKATVCLDPGNKNCVNIDPELTEIMADSRDYEELLKVWKGWRDATGRKMKDTFIGYVNLSNEGVQSLGYEDTGAEWRSNYETDTLEEDVLALLNDIFPLYEQLHAYVRRKLKKQYGEDKFPASGHIPAHLLGNMWAQEWSNILDIVVPYPDKPSMDVTQAMHDQDYNVSRMFRDAEDFFVSLGMEPMTDTFWERSMFVKPTDGREVVCHASADDFFTADDYRIKMCTVVTQGDLVIIHHEMGHIEYFMQYSHQPCVYREGANPGFHEAVGDLMALSVNTPEHLYKMDLIDQVPQDAEADINFLMKTALDKVAFLPFGYIMDLWRFSVFRGDTTPDNYNTHWWNNRCRYQGVSSPITRTEDDFDPGSKYHIPADVPYIRYFVSFIIQFQFHKAVCDAAGWTGPLHRCDIYNNADAGKLIRDTLKMGLSKPWPDAMEKMTGQKKMDAGPLLEYFKPLYEFLVKENGNDYGWRPMCPTEEELILPTKCPQNVGDSGERIHFTLLTFLIIPLAAWMLF